MSWDWQSNWNPETELRPGKFYNRTRTSLLALLNAYLVRLQATTLIATQAPRYLLEEGPTDDQTALRWRTLLHSS